MATPVANVQGVVSTPAAGALALPRSGSGGLTRDISWARRWAWCFLGIALIAFRGVGQRRRES
jgi:hypothetical protein